MRSLTRTWILLCSLFVLGACVGVASTLLWQRASNAPSGFSLEEAKAKLGRRVKLKGDAHSDPPRFVNTGIVAYVDERDGERVLVIDWDNLLPGMKHRITYMDCDSYTKLVAED